MMEWFEKSREVGTRHTRSLPRASRWERLYFRVFGLNTRSVVDRRMEALAQDEAEWHAWLRDNPPPVSKQ